MRPKQHFFSGTIIGLGLIAEAFTAIHPSFAQIASPSTYRISVTQDHVVED